jgi:hypothetical protein
MDIGETYKKYPKERFLEKQGMYVGLIFWVVLE